MTRPIVIDLFAGGGGASEGIRMAIGCDPAVAVNHDPKAIAMHKANHPGTQHVCQDVWGCPPILAALVRANYTEDFATREGRELPLLGVGRG